VCRLLRESANYRTIAERTYSEWSQAPCLMTNQPAARAMTTPNEVIHPDVRSEEPKAVVPTVVQIGVQTGVQIGVLGAGLIARDSAAVRCWCRRSRGCPSRPSPRA
jgi:hypothetical protein